MCTYVHCRWLIGSITRGTSKFFSLKNCYLISSNSLSKLVIDCLASVNSHLSLSLSLPPSLPLSPSLSCEAVVGLCHYKALLVAVSYMARVTPKVADRAVEIAQGEAPSTSVDPGENTYGLKTAQFLFTIGTRFLKK